MNIYERQIFFTEINFKFPAFAELNSHEKCIYVYHVIQRQPDIEMVLGKFYTNHWISATRKSMGRVSSPNIDILARPTDES